MAVGKACGVMLFLVGCLVGLTQAQEVPTGSRPSAAVTVARNGWAGDESVLARALILRAQRLQEETGIDFDRGWPRHVSLEWSLGTAGPNGFDAIYKAETQTVYFPIRIWNELAARHRPASGCLNADIAAADVELSELLDHELGHELMDQVSRRNGLGPWFTDERFRSSTGAEQLGLNILSEGTAVFFQRLDSPRDDSGLSERAFPATRDEQALYTYRMIVFDGGYWLVRDVLSHYGERGLIWLMRHPFIADDNMRGSAVAYRERALRELSQ